MKATPVVLASSSISRAANRTNYCIKRWRYSSISSIAALAVARSTPATARVSYCNCRTSFSPAFAISTCPKWAITGSVCSFCRPPPPSVRLARRFSSVSLKKRASAFWVGATCRPTTPPSVIPRRRGSRSSARPLSVVAKCTATTNWPLSANYMSSASVPRTIFAITTSWPTATSSIRRVSRRGP